MCWKNFFYLLSYGCLRGVVYPFSFLPYAAIHKIGSLLGPIVFHLVPKYRKRTLSNLSLAADLSFTEEELILQAKKSLASLLITCLEYGKIYKEKKIQELVSCANPALADEILSKGKGLIFLCAHQAK